MTHLAQPDRSVAAMTKRAIAWATSIGAVAGGSLGVLFWPLVGTVVGALVGGGFGLLLGLLNAVALSVAARTRWPLPVAVGSCASVSGLMARLMCPDGLGAAMPGLTWRDVFALACGLTAAVLGPLILCRTAAEFGDSRPGRNTCARVLRHESRRPAAVTDRRR